MRQSDIGIWKNGIGGGKNRDERNAEEKRALYWLCCCPCLGAVSIRKLGSYFGSYQELINIEETALEKAQILTSTQKKGFLQWKKEFSRCSSAYDRMGDKRIRFVTPLDLEYPQRLLEISDYPMGLFLYGALPSDDKPSVAVVGARGCSSYGEQIAEAFSKALAAEGVQIISGLAAGIDGAAHRGALKAGQPTFGVLGCGINQCYPPEHYRLFERMKEQGGVLSEFPIGEPPRPRNFPMRNRLISGLADAVLVVEAREKSGSLITAELGLNQGREIFAVPGRVTDPLSKGCNQLIQQGAHMAILPNDILEYLGLKYKKTLIMYEKDVNGLAKKEKMVYSCLDFKPKHIDEILSEAGLPLSECMAALMELELGGYAYRSANHYYGKQL